jgi:chitinase
MKNSTPISLTFMLMSTLLSAYCYGASESDGASKNPIKTPAFSVYKDVTVDADLTSAALQSSVTGAKQAITSAMPRDLSTLTWAFANGTCGAEKWGSMSADAMASNVSKFVAAGKKYIVSTGGQGGVFTCDSDANFNTFIKTYYSANLVGIDFDIEAGQSQADIDNLVARVHAAQATYPDMKFYFTVGTWAPSKYGSALALDMGPTKSATDAGSPNPLGPYGVMVMKAIQAANLTNYTINLMTMDYGTPASSSICVVRDAACDMGQSAIQAAMDFHGYYGIPYSQIALTSMSGPNDVADEIFTNVDTDTLTAWSKTKGIAALSFWSFDRDVGLSYTNAFISGLGY